MAGVRGRLHTASQELQALNVSQLFVYKKNTLSKHRRISSGEGWWLQTPKCAASHMEEEREGSQLLALQLKPVLKLHLCKGLIHASLQGQARGILNRDEIVGHWAKRECFNIFFELCSRTPLSITVGISVHFAWQRLRCQPTFGPVKYRVVAPTVWVCCKTGLEPQVWSSRCLTQTRAVASNCRGWRGEHVCSHLLLSQRASEPGSGAWTFWAAEQGIAGGAEA